MFNLLNPKYWFQKRASALDDARVRLEQTTQFNTLFHLDPDKITRAITSYNAGDLGELARIIRDFEERDDKMATCAMKMRASVGRCDYTVLVKEGYEDDARAKRHAEILKRFWSTASVTNRFNMNERGGLRLLKKQMMEAQSYGYAVHEIVWKPLANGELTAEFVKLPLWHFENKTGSLRFLPSATASEGVPMAGGEWLVTTGDGVGIPAAICAMAKRMCFQDWLLFSERSGMPIIVGKTGAAFKSEQWDNIRRAVRSIYRDTRVLLDSASSIESIDTGNASSIPFPPLVEWADRAIASLYRGADLSTISKGDGTGASLQGDESGMLEQDAADNLSETLHEQVDAFVIRYATGDEEPLATIRIEPVTKPDVDTDIKIDTHLVAMGCRLSKQDMMQRYGRTEAKDEGDVAVAAQPANGGQGLAALPSMAGLGGGFANEEKVKARGEGEEKVKVRGEGEQRNGSNSSVNLNLKPQPVSAGNLKHQTSNIKPQPDSVLAAFAKDTGPAAKAVEELLKEMEKVKGEGEGEQRKALADKFLADLPNLMPEDPAMAAVIAEEMAKAFGASEVEKRGGGGQRKDSRNSQALTNAARDTGHLAGANIEPDVFYLFNEDREQNGRLDTKGSGDKTQGRKNESNMERRQRTSREALDAYNASTDHPSVEDVASGKVSVEDALKKGFEIKFGGQKIIFFTDVLSEHYEGRESRLALVKKAISDRNKMMPGRHYDGQTVLMAQKRLQPTEKKLVVIADADTGVARSIVMAQQNYCDRHFKLWGRK